ncbi:MAG: YrhK family protein [Actinomycetota bacterium]|nr:YrhK family protein [Actinomycetota bacterium]
MTAWIWAPTRLLWWIAVLFIIGSACFALGSMPLYTENVSPRTTGFIFFVGSIFFTSASLCQYLQTVNPYGEHRRRVFVWDTNSPDWVAAVVQFAGTLLFNVTTFHALQTSLDAQEADRLVWAPDALGSVCFLISSYVAFMTMRHRVIPGGRDTDWWMATLNLVGSVAFGISAIASLVLPTTDEAVNIRTVNVQTFIGAVCFLVAAYMLIPQMAKERV